MSLNERAFGIVIVFLGVALLSCVGGIIFLTGTGNTVPDILENTTTGIVTGLIGLLVRTPNQSKE